MSRNIFLVSCVSQKRTYPCTAKEMYISDWFLKASRYAIQKSDEWYILSARYYLINPEIIIEPYNLTLKTMKIADRKNWAKRVLFDLHSILKPNDKITFLAGTAYREFLEPYLRTNEHSISIPMENLRIGEQLSWLTQNLSR